MEKIINISELDGLLELLKKEAVKIVFTNGCFDVLHVGHIDYLQKAKKLGDLLVVGINTDASVKRLKGHERPINTLKDRMLMLAALECVDFVIDFGEDTPYELINKIKPDVLVKASDYKLSEIVGSDIVLENGGKVLTLDYLPSYSSSSIIEKIKALKE